MKHLLVIYLLLLVIVEAKSQKDTITELVMQLIDKKVPVYQNTTIDGKRIDSNYFKGKVTVLSFFGFGCSPCHQELSLLSELGKSLPKDKYQILLIGDGAEKDLRELRAYHSKRFGKWKRKLGIDTLAFDVIADCPNTPVHFLYKACRGSTGIFKAYGLPTTFFINREGIIRQISRGFTVPRCKEADEEFYSLLKKTDNL